MKVDISAALKVYKKSKSVCFSENFQFISNLCSEGNSVVNEDNVLKQFYFKTTKITEHTFTRKNCWLRLDCLCQTFDKKFEKTEFPNIQTETNSQNCVA